MLEPTFVNFLVSMLFGILTGVVCPVFGIGGGAFMVPFLILFAGLEMKNAVAVSLLCVVGLSSLATAFNLEKCLVRVKLGISMAFFAISGAILSAYAADYMPEKILMIIFPFLLFFISFSMFFRSEKKAENQTGGKHSYFDENCRKEVSYDIKNFKTVSFLSFFGGGLAGLFGIGGGIVQVPLINLLAKAPIKVAAATSSFIVSMSACAAASVFFRKGFIVREIATPMFLGVIIGSFIGVRILHKSRSEKIRKIFAILLFLAAVKIFLKALSL